MWPECEIKTFVDARGNTVQYQESPIKGGMEYNVLLNGEWEYVDAYSFNIMREPPKTKKPNAQALGCNNGRMFEDYE